MLSHKNKAIKKKFNRQAIYLYVSIWLCLAGLLLWLFIPFHSGNFNFNQLSIIIFGWFGLAYLPFLFQDFKRKRAQQLFNQLNAHPQMEYSTQLLLKETTYLNALEKIQLTKIEPRLQSILKQIKTKHFIGKALLCFLFNLLMVGLVIQFALKDQVENISIKKNLTESTKNYELEYAPPIPEVVELQQYKINIAPPAYTNLKTSTTQQLNIQVAEGSSVTWHLHFNKKTPLIQLENMGKVQPFSTSDSIQYNFTLKPKQQTHYNIISDSLVKGKLFNNLYKIEVIPDQKPVANIINLKNYTSVQYDEIQHLPIRFILNDDYGISKASLQITKSSGEGEAVQFEQKDYTINNLKRGAEQDISIDLNALKPAPGDEFFIRLQAIDNKPVKPQSAFSDSYIIAVEDTTQQQASFEMALGMDVEPEYFRSQRQIIIDTEALIEQKSKMNEATFKDESNNLGIEQKLLRLRYGKFLGEEFEGEIGVRGDRQEVSKQEEATHVHDEANDHKEHQDDKDIHHEHNHEEHEHRSHQDCEHDHKHHQHQEHEVDKEDNSKEHEHHHDHRHDHHGHDHGTTSENPEEPENWLAPFMHFHDNAESNTFFESEVKAKLKAALAQMWDAELQLRLAQPKLSLPYQYKALKLIKEVQQASRVYVERVGLDLPEIDADKKRLSGELDEIINPQKIVELKENELYFILELALQKAQYLLSEKLASDKRKHHLNEIKKLLAPLQQENAFIYAKCMHLLQQSQSDLIELQKLQRILNDFVGNQFQVSGKSVNKNSRLENLYWEHLGTF